MSNALRIGVNLFIIRTIILGQEAVKVYTITTMNDTEAFILAGGASSRMGTDKSLLPIEGQTFTERIAETLLTVTDSVSVVGRQSDSSLPSVADVYPQWGALGGLHAALTACKRAWAIVVACDLPFVRAELFSFLA